METLIGRTNDHAQQIHQLIQQYFTGFLDEAAALAATREFETTHPPALAGQWLEQVPSQPHWRSLLAALRCGQLLPQPPRVVLGQVFGSQQIGEQLQSDFSGLTQEQLLLLCLDTKNQIVKRQIIFQGTLNSCPAHPREIFQVALATTTARIVIAHNHPSGDAEPSHKDVEFTKRLQISGELLGIPLLDCFVIGASDYFSFAEQGLLNCNTEF